jgi:soluble lytic murein transglycosylase-like protein
MQNDLKAIVIAAAAAHELPAAVVCAIVTRESSWNPWVIRFEPAFFNRYVLPAYTNNKFDITEAKARSFSWGLMQVMGQVARESGFTGPLASLCDPTIGAPIGCKVFASKLELAGGDVGKGLQLWNGGSNPNYAAEVLTLAAHADA